MSLRFIVFLESYLGVIGCFLLSKFNWFCNLFRKQRPETSVTKLLFIKFIEQGALILHRQCFAEAVLKYGKSNVYIVLFEESVPTAWLLNLFEDSNIISINHSSFTKLITTGVNALLTCKRLGIDTTIDLEFFSTSSAIFSYLTGAKNRVGYYTAFSGQKYRGDLLTHKLNYSPYVHVSQTGRVLLQSLMIPVSQLPAVSSMDTNFTIAPFQSGVIQPSLKELYKIVPESLFTTHKVIIINPNFRDQLPLRQWQPDNYVDLVNSLASKKQECFFVFTGRPDEYDITNVYLGKIKTKQTLNICGKTDLHTLFNLYIKSCLIITTDSGPAHFASLTQLPGIVIFGPETPVLYGPLSPDIKVIYKNLPCSPCFNAYNNRVSACSNNLCVNSVQPGEVAQMAEQMLSKI